MSQTIERSAWRKLEQLFYREQPLRGLYHGYPVFGLPAPAETDPLTELEILSRTQGDNTGGEILNRTVHHAAETLSTPVIQRTHPLRFVRHIQEGLAGCITFYGEQRTEALSLYAAQLELFVKRAMAAHQTGCRPEYELAITELTFVQEWLLSNQDVTPGGELKHAAATLVEYCDHLARRIPLLDTSCQIGAGPIAELYLQHYDRELELESELEKAREFRQSIHKRLLQECGLFHQRFQAEMKVEAIPFTLRELAGDAPRPEEIPAVLMRQVTRLLQYQIDLELAPATSPPRDSSYLEFVSHAFDIPHSLGPGEDGQTRLRLSPAAPRNGHQFPRQHSFSRLEIEAVRITLHQNLVACFPSPLLSELLPRENRRGLELFWLHTLQRAGWGKGDIRLRIISDLTLLQEVVTFIALLEYHALGEDEHLILAGLTQDNCFNREEALTVVATIKLDPLALGWGYPVFRELKRLDRYYRRKLGSGITRADFNRVLFTGALLPVGSLSRYLSRQFSQMLAVAGETTPDKAPQHD